MAKTISIIIPAYNEVDNIVAMTNAVHDVMQQLVYDYELLYVNDGSIDNTFKVLQELSKKDNHVKYISFSRNFGKDNALKAGIDLSNSDCVITMDSDLQHPPILIPELIKKWEQGSEIVYAYREFANPHTSFFSKVSSKMFWKILNLFSSLELENGISDFRLLDSKVVSALKNINEFEIFFRGMVKWVGYTQTGIPYLPNERENGETTYSKMALLKLAVQGITSFSTKPLTMVIFLGTIISSFAFVFFAAYILYSVINKLAISGWASLLSTVVFFGGLNLIVLGIIGVYIGKLFMQAKGRPNYLISETNYK